MMYTFTKRTANNKTPMAVKGFIYDNIFDILADWAVMLKEEGKSDSYISLSRTKLYANLSRDDINGYCLNFKGYAYFIEKIRVNEPINATCNELYY